MAIPPTFPSIETEQAAIRGSRCIAFLSENGCYPWALPRRLWIFMAFPGLGIVPSCFCWGWKERQIEILDEIDFQNSQDAQIEMAVDANASIPLTASEGPSSAQIVTINPESETYRIQNQIRYLLAQKANATALFLINLTGSILVGATIYTLSKMDLL